MYLKRKADKYLNEWKQDIDRKPLIVYGARQVGKTRTIREFAKNNYDNVVEINFVLSPVYKEIVEDGYSVDNIVKLISRINPSLKFVPNKTLIFFDEIQEFPDITTSLKFFKEDGRFDVICSGSMLGIQYNHINSISVGYKTDYKMYSMDFEEFLWAKGYKDDVIEDMLNNMLNLKPFNNLESSLFSGLFLDYCILGGMPDVVNTYINKNTFEGSLESLKQLSIDYEGDMIKYSSGLDKAKIINVYRSIPAQLAKENKKFQYSKISHGARAKDYDGCITWLEDAGIIKKCVCLNFPGLPLKGNTAEDKFKVYMMDTGLLISQLDEQAQQDVRSGKNLGVYKGALYENFVAEALVKQGYSLYYYSKSNSTLEEDFFIRSQSELLPIKVKSNNGMSKSLNTLINDPYYSDIKNGIKITSGNIGYNNNVLTLPHFCVFLLKRYMEKQALFK